MSLIEKDDLEKIKVANAKKIAVQLPDGMRTKAAGIVKELEKAANADIIILGDSCFGACDLRDNEARELGCDLLVHFGHTPIYRGIIPTVFVEAKSDLNVDKIIKKAEQELHEERIGLITTVQYVHKLDDAKKILERNQKKVFLGKPTGRSMHTGQILGCDFTSAKKVAEKVDCFLYIGSGNFHPIGVALDTNRTVYVADPEKNELRDVEGLKDRLLRQRFAKIEKAKKAKKFGIIVSIKKGQRREDEARLAKRMLEEADKEVLVVAMDEVSPEKLMNFRLDCWVSTACPRIAIDDASRYGTPVLTPFELEIVLGKRKWEEYEMDKF